jgi:hypothetical protein
MKRFLVFTGDAEPLGGMSDFDNDFDTLEEAHEFVTTQRNHYDWAQIYDQQNLYMVKSYKSHRGKMYVRED